MHPRAREFAERADEGHGLSIEVEEFPEGTRTAADAAAALGCEVGQIASSIVFLADGRTVVVVTSGANRVSEAKLADLLGVEADDVRTADPEEISERVGWSIGGVPPVCHDGDFPTFVDEDLLSYGTVWAAAGTPEAVFPIDPERLRDAADAELADVAE
jgi:prolyl-tRNA editing enzyme YbaK/EbsC (Cys-tRNA(Pro) deacylase)